MLIYQSFPSCSTDQFPCTYVAIFSKVVVLSFCTMPLALYSSNGYLHGACLYPFIPAILLASAVESMLVGSTTSPLPIRFRNKPGVHRVVALFKHQFIMGQAPRFFIATMHSLPASGEEINEQLELLRRTVDDPDNTPEPKWQLHCTAGGSWVDSDTMWRTPDGRAKIVTVPVTTGHFLSSKQMSRS